MIQPFSITSDSIQLIKETGNTKLNYIDLASGITSPALSITPVSEYDAIGYNPLDNYLYGYDTAGENVVKIGIDPTSITYPYIASNVSVTNLPTNDFNVGDVDTSGMLYLYRGTDNNYVKINLNDKTFSIVAITGLDIQDWVSSPVTTLLYTVDSNGKYYEINSNDGTLEYLGNLLPAGSYGSFYADSDGNIYTINNNDGTIYKVIPNGASTSFMTLASNTGDSAQDGARLATTSIDILSANKSIGEDYNELGLGEVLDYFIQLTNNSTSLTATNVKLTDYYSDYLIFSDNSVQINNESIVWGADPKNGVDLGNIAPNTSILVSFQVQCLTTAPIGEVISNTALITYTNGITIESNNVSITVADNNLALRKSADKSLALVGDMVNYTVVVENLTDSLLTGLSIGDNVVPVNGTVKLDGVSVTTSGIDGTIYIPDVTVPANGQVVVNYQVKVVAGYQSIGYIENGAEAEYQTDQEDPNSEVAQPSNNVYVQVPPLGRGVLFIN